MFLHFWQKFENSKWPLFLGRGNFFENWQEYIFLDTLWVETFNKITLSRTVKATEENFLKIAKTSLLRYCVGRKFQRNRSISHG